eukprot:Nk52_evm4s2391 gene=Nk52_evmTU4s2391
MRNNKGSTAVFFGAVLVVLAIFNTAQYTAALPLSTLSSSSSSSSPSSSSSHNRFDVNDVFIDQVEELYPSYNRLLDMDSHLITSNNKDNYDHAGSGFDEAVFRATRRAPRSVEEFIRDEMSAWAIFGEEQHERSSRGLVFSFIKAVLNALWRIFSYILERVLDWLNSILCKIPVLGWLVSTMVKLIFGHLNTWMTCPYVSTVKY